MKTKRLLAIILAFAMVMSIVPVSSLVVFAADVYSNTEPESCDEHSFVNGFCTFCDFYEAPMLVTSDNYTSLNLKEEHIGYYAIENAGQLYWFAALVDGTLNDGTEKNIDASAVLTENITVNKNLCTELISIPEHGALGSDGYLLAATVNEGKSVRVWTPIGEYGSDNSLRGNFDGNGKFVSGLYYNDGVTTGRFGLIAVSYGTVKNVSVIDSYFYAHQSVGAICGDSYGKIENCYSNAYIATTKGWQVGGICGYLGGEIIGCCFDGEVAGARMVGGIAGYVYDVALIEDCYNTAAVYGQFQVGGICGATWNEVDIKNCYNIGQVRTCSDSGAICGNLKKISTVENCYYEEGCHTTGVGTISESTVTSCESKSDFSTGEVTYLLNNGVTDGSQAWYQTLGEDNYPQFSGKTIFYDGTEYFNGVTITLDGVETETDGTIVLGIDNTDGTYSLPENTVGYYIDDTFVDAGKYAVEGGEVITTVDFNVTMLTGAQVRYGGGLDENGKVYSGNGLRFLAQVDRSGFDAEGYGMKITAEGSTVETLVDAKKWQDDTTFSVALTDMAESNYIRKFTATPFVKVKCDNGTEKTIYGTQTVTRSIYQVAAGLLKDETQTAYGLSDVLNAYANQTGIRLVVKDGELKANTSYTTNGAYRLTEEELHFEVSDAEYDAAGNKYSVILTALGNAEIITDNDFWYDYIRINNNNSLIKDKVTVESVEGNSKAVKVTFAADGLIERPADKNDNTIPDNAGDGFDGESEYN